MDEDVEGEHFLFKSMNATEDPLAEKTDEEKIVGKWKIVEMKVNDQDFTKSLKGNGYIVFDEMGFVEFKDDSSSASSQYELYGEKKIRFIPEKG